MKFFLVLVALVAFTAAAPTFGGGDDKGPKYIIVQQPPAPAPPPPPPAPAVSLLLDLINFKTQTNKKNI